MKNFNRFVIRIFVTVLLFISMSMLDAKELNLQKWHIDNDIKIDLAIITRVSG
jgi:hypothetical protein